MLGENCCGRGGVLETAPHMVAAVWPLLYIPGDGGDSSRDPTHVADCCKEFPRVCKSHSLAPINIIQPQLGGIERT